MDKVSAAICRARINDYVFNSRIVLGEDRLNCPLQELGLIKQYLMI